ncbi:MAG: hypothetical protein JWM95_5050 [Gemmatimonadetes bacterium]|nr:hypothetical protein [Gemmatimonadota bacterium]
MTDERRVLPERRTQALRGPGAGGFTPPQSLSASNPCLNCGTNIQLDYCPECGQREIDSDPTLREFVRELAEEFVHWDGKLVTTYRTLIAKPGTLTCEYLAGRRVRYISPLRIYLACSVVFFFLSALTPKRIVTDRNGHEVEQGMVQVSPSTPAELTELETEANSASGFKRIWLTHFARASAEPQKLQHATLAAIPQAMFVLVPFFAALVGFAYRDRRRKYPQHLAFALHVHAVLFLALSLMLVGRLFPSAQVALVCTIIVAIPFALYLVRATRLVYEGTTGQVVRRLSLVVVLYGAAFLAALTALLAAAVLAS